MVKIRLLSKEVVVVFLVLLMRPIAAMLILPSLPAMKNYFITSQETIELAISFYFFSSGFSQLVYGPVSDKYGRRNVLLIGLSIFLISSVLCSFSTTIFQFQISWAAYNHFYFPGFTLYLAQGISLVVVSLLSINNLRNLSLLMAVACIIVVTCYVSLKKIDFT